MTHVKFKRFNFWCWLFWHRFHPICETIAGQRTTVACVRCATAVEIYL